MELSEYESKRGGDRQLYVKIYCEQCGSEKWVRWIRVKKGQGRFCSRECANERQTIDGLARRGKEFAFYVYDKSKNESYAHWKDAEGHQHTTTYVRWLWEHVNGEIPEGYKFRWKDGNPKNIAVENIEIVTPEMFKEEVSNRLRGHVMTLETREKISRGHTGRKRWNGLVKELRYSGFSRWIKKRVKERDGYLCQACGTNLFGSSKSRIHHVDGNKLNSDMQNLILVCNKCHSEIHSKQKVNTRIEELRVKLV